MADDAEQFEAELLDCADNPRGNAAATPRDGMPVWGTNFDEWLSDELAIRRGELERRPHRPQEPAGKSKYARKQRRRG